MSNNLTAITLEEISWQEGTRAASLNRVYAQVTASARGASAWYQAHKKPKKYGAMFLRWASVMLISLSGILPLISTLIDDTGTSAPIIDPLWTSLAVAVAAALFGLDRFFNYSSGWMRYVRTDLALRTAISEFELEWQIARAAWGAPEPTLAQTADMLGRCRAFAVRINAIEAEETNLWIAEFQASLARLGDTVKAEEPRDDRRRDPEATDTRKIPAETVTGGKVFQEADVDAGQTADTTLPDPVVAGANEPEPSEASEASEASVPPLVPDPLDEPTNAADPKTETAVG